LSMAFPTKPVPPVTKTTACGSGFEVGVAISSLDAVFPVNRTYFGGITIKFTHNCSLVKGKSTNTQYANEIREEKAGVRLQSAKIQR
jgi:hypothetical protein